MSNSQMLSVSCLIMFVRFRPFLVVSNVVFLSPHWQARRSGRSLRHRPPNSMGSCHGQLT
jgi:hypothetical protein